MEVVLLLDEAGGAVYLTVEMTSPGAIAFQIGPLVIRWYGILMATAIVVGLWMAHRQAKKEGLPADDIVSAGQWAILAGLVGARAYEVIFNWDYYSQYPSKIIAVWEGGLAIHGGLIVGPLVGAWLAYRWHIPVLRALDVAAPYISLGQAIGRWGNFFNEEAFGQPTNLPWKLYISPSHRPPAYADYDYFHPTFLYESLWDFAVFVVLVTWLRPHLRDRPGALFFCYVALYSIGRFAIEAIRLDSFWLGQFRVPQIASLAGLVVALVGLAWARRRTPRAPVAAS
jgi:phosphatidylglycerol---prolipoprotein diacylglyceryl transferase